MISLKDLLKTPRFSDLKLLTNPDNLDVRVIESVEITETPDVEKYIPENVLILTTAMVFKDKPNDLIPFIDSLSRAKAIGLAIKTGRFLNEIDEEVIAYANKVNFPLLIIPDYYRLGTLLHQIMNIILETEREEIDFALDIQKRFSDLLVHDASNDLLVREFSKMIKSPIILIDPLEQIISASHHFKNYMKKAIYYINAIRTESLKVNRNFGSFIVEELDGSTTHLSLVKINIHAYFPHYLIIVNPEKVPYPTSLFAFEQAALVFQFNLYKNQKIDESLYTNEAHFFSDLLNSQIRDIPLETNWVSLSRKYGYAQSDYYQVIHINIKDIANNLNHSPTLKMDEKLFLSYRWLRSNINQYFNQTLAIWHAENNEIVLILQEEPDDLSDKLLKISGTIQPLIDSQLIFSIGYSVTDLHHIEQSYTQAKLAYSEQQNDDEIKTIVYYQDNGAEHLFKQLDQNEVIYFCKSVLKELAYPTEDSKLDLRNTLDAYLRNQGEITQTSNDLFIHRNTVKYRINGCEEILGVKIDDPEVSLNLRLALELSK